ncbi:MAG: hypothetical protein PVJ64_01005, partial [Gemmatimonadales bacterium]
LAKSDSETARADQFRSECRFLITAHGIERVVLLFHGPAEDGPRAAMCGDYQRRHPRSSPADIQRQQEEDAEQIREDGLGEGVRLEFYRYEATKDGRVCFVELSV